jgi:HK97 family phage major capsid protein
VKRARKLKDGNSQYLWSPGLSGQPGTILDRPYVMSEYVPDTYTTGLYVAAVGDFSYYWIVDSLDMEIQRLDELFALKNQVGMVVRKETDGMPVLSEAFARLKLA